MWCWTIGSPATGKSGLGTSRDKGRNLFGQFFEDQISLIKPGPLLRACYKNYCLVDRHYLLYQPALSVRVYNIIKTRNINVTPLCIDINAGALKHMI